MQFDTPPAIQTWGLTKAIGDFSLRDVNLHVPVGALCTVLGAPGSGKTMLVKLLLGLHDPDAGQRMIFGRNVALDRVETRLGYAPQTSLLPDTITIEDVLRYFMLLSCQPYADLRAVQDVLTAVRLKVDLNEYVGALNSGQRQRLHLASALLANPQLLLLDEPAATLTSAERHEFLDTVRAISTDRTVLYTTSVPEDIHYASDYLIVLEKGTLVAHGVTADLIENADYALYHLTIQGETSTVYDLLVEQAWIHSIEVQHLHVFQKWFVRVQDEDQAERSLLRAILADRNLTVLEFKKVRGRLTDVITSENTHLASNVPSSN